MEQKPFQAAEPLNTDNVAKVELLVVKMASWLPLRSDQILKEQSLMDTSWKIRGIVEVSRNFSGWQE